MKREVRALRGNGPNVAPRTPDSAWVHSHYVEVIDQFESFTRGDGYELENKTLLDVGCGDGLIDYGLLRLPLRNVVGLDIVDASSKDLGGLSKRISEAGFDAPADVSRFSHVSYDGTQMPFENATFDIVFSWSAFEHVAEVDLVLAEIVRVLKDDGFAFIQVFPWFASHYGSHLADHISTPYFHLNETNSIIRRQLEIAVNEKPKEKDFVLGHLWTEFTHLNKISADDFYTSIKKAGLVAKKARLISMDDDLSNAPTNYSLSELMIAGTMMILTKREPN